MGDTFGQCFEKSEHSYPAQAALNWTICKGTVPIPGAKNAKQAAENLGAMGWRLKPEEVTALDAASNLPG